MRKRIRIALVGNPNSGKSSLFNVLTGLNQKIGNFPGVTVDKKTGSTSISESISADVTDLPGMYSLYPKRADEWVSYKVLMQPDETLRPDLIVLIADASNLKRNLLFCSQIIDLKLPVIIAFTMMDLAKRKGIQIDIPGLERELGVPIVAVNPRKNRGISGLKKMIEQRVEASPALPARSFIDMVSLAPGALEALKTSFPHRSEYAAFHLLVNHEHFAFEASQENYLYDVSQAHHFNATRGQAEEIMQRYTKIRHIMQQTVVMPDPLQKTLFTEKLDDILLHRTWGYVILLLVLFLIFQSIFALAQYPMDAIEWSFAALSTWLNNVLPTGWFSDLFVNGIIAGLSGILLFVPQIMILFGLINLLEDTGYMARISFLTDKLMRKVGLNGKSVMPMISGLACAVPAIMSTRNIENRKERLLTILVTPLMSCSARLPVYTILIALVVPQRFYLGFISLHGLVMLALYLLGTVMALFVAWVFKWFIRSKERSFFILELPVYRSPRWTNIFYSMLEKAKIFSMQAGKVIMVISLLLWGLSNYGPPEKMNAVSREFERAITNNPAASDELQKSKNAALLQNSYAGILGKAIEPAIAPLGFDWKIGIALVTSFAAREVFVGTMATLYSVGEEAYEENATLRMKMSAAVSESGKKIYTLATGLSLLVFYVLAMQCMSTVAVVKRETRTWKWPLIQVAYMTALAYVMSWAIYNLFK